MSRDKVPPSLRLGIAARSGKTLTQITFKLSAGSREIVFQNNAAAGMSVDFDSAKSVLDKTGKHITSISVPKNGYETIDVANFMPGDELRYTAKVDGAAAEDPIIIFED